MTKYTSLPSGAPCFSPSQTDAFSTCPVLWLSVYRTRAVPRRFGPRELGGLLGTAFAAGMATYWGGARSAHQACGRAIATLRQEVARVTPACDLSALPALAALEEGLVQAMSNVFKNWSPPGEVLFIEQTRPAFGYARADMVCRLPGGELIVVDFKCKRTLDAKYAPALLEEYQQSTAAHHYVWMEEAVAFQPVIVRMEPFRVWEEPYYFTPARINAWVAASLSKWTIMQDLLEGRRVPWEASTHTTRFGPCILKDVCLGPQVGSPTEPRVSPDLIVLPSANNP